MTSTGIEPPRSHSSRLRVRGVSKRFGPRLVLDRLDLDIAAGEVHALLGANGSGKSTFVKILSGNQRASEVDQFDLDATPVDSAASVSDLQARGLRVVHQDLGLVDELTITENIALSRYFVRNRMQAIDWRATRAAAQEALDVVGLDRNVRTTVGELAAWERVAVVFARALYGGLDNVRLLVLDEITAALPSEEVERVIEVAKRLRGRGAGVLYVTHRFEEVFQVADTITVLRDGKVIHRSPTDEITPPELVDLVAGRTITSAPAVRADLAARATGLELHVVTNEQLRGVSCSVRAGEIVGVVGRAGCGRSALGRAVFGLQGLRQGSIEVGGTRLTPGKPWAALKAGVAYVGQDRGRAGSIHAASVLENLTIASLDTMSRGGWLVRSREKRLARQLIDDCTVVPPDPDAMIEHLSGGNQQKIVLGRWIPRSPKVLVLDEPTEGVDVGARQSIYTIIRGQAAAGCAVLLLSSSIEELVQLCDRVLFLVNGQVATELSGEQLAVETIESLLLYREDREEQADGTTSSASAGTEQQETTS